MHPCISCHGMAALQDLCNSLNGCRTVPLGEDVERVGLLLAPKLPRVAGLVGKAHHREWNIKRVLHIRGNGARRYV